MSYFINSVQEQSPVLNGLIGWWKMDEGTGLTTKDSSILGNNGTLTNMPVWVGGKLAGHSLNFNGSNNYVDIGAGKLKAFATITITAWVNLTGIGTTDNLGIFVSDAVSAPYNGYSVYIRKSDGAIGKYFSNFIYSTINKISFNVWSFIAVSLLINASGNINVSKNGAAWETIFSGDTSLMNSTVSTNISNIGRWSGANIILKE